MLMVDVAINCYTPQESGTEPNIASIPRAMPLNNIRKIAKLSTCAVEYVCHRFPPTIHRPSQAGSNRRSFPNTRAPSTATSSMKATEAAHWIVWGQFKPRATASWPNQRSSTSKATVEMSMTTVDNHRTLCTHGRPPPPWRVRLQ